MNTWGQTGELTKQSAQAPSFAVPPVPVTEPAVCLLSPDSTCSGSKYHLSFTKRELMLRERDKCPRVTQGGCGEPGFESKSLFVDNALD